MTILFSVVVIGVLAVTFAVAYKIRGVKVALLSTIVVLLGLIGIYVGLIYIITNSMN